MCVLWAITSTRVSFALMHHDCVHKEFDSHCSFFISLARETLSINSQAPTLTEEKEPFHIYMQPIYCPWTRVSSIY